MWSKVATSPSAQQTVTMLSFQEGKGQLRLCSYAGSQL